MKKKLTIINWSAILVLYGLFSIWHGAFEGPLTPEEIEVFVNKYQVLNPEKDTKRIRALMESDDGQPKYMVNAIKLYDSPQLINGKKVGESSAEILETYTNHVFSFLLRHGSYPIYSGNAVFDAVERWGAENVDEWTSGAIYWNKPLLLLFAPKIVKTPMIGENLLPIRLLEKCSLSGA